jgi:hypothetical protein
MWKEPDAVRDFIAGPHGNIASPSMISQVARAESAKNPESAMEWANHLPADRRRSARSAVLDQWVRVRPEGAMNFVRALPAGPEREQGIQSVTQNLIYQSPAQVATWMNTLPASDQRMIRDLATRWNLPAEQRRLFDAK